MSTATWLKELCPELADWQIELIVDHINEAIIAERKQCVLLCEKEAGHFYERFEVSNDPLNFARHQGADECAIRIWERCE